MADQPSNPTSSSTSAGIRSQLAIVRRYAWFTILVVVVALGATFVLTQRQERTYSASARVLLRTNQTVSLFPFSATGPRQLARSAQTEVLFVQSPSFIGTAKAQSPTGVNVRASATEDELLFTGTGTIPDDIAAAANAWADAYVVERHAAFVVETESSIAFLEDAIAELNAERAGIRQEVIALDELLADTTDPDQFSRILSQKVSIESLLLPQLAPIDRQISDFGRDLADLELVTRFLESPETSARVVRTASAPTNPVSPNVTRNLAVGAILGLALGLGLPYLRHALGGTVDDRGDVAETTGLPILGTIPSYKHANETTIEVLEHPASIASEHYQAVLTAIEFASTDEPISSLLFTSAISGEGKTTTAVNLAALASRYMNVILVDADMRRPSVHKFVGGSNQLGLSDVLQGTADFFDARVVFEQDETRFDVLPAGRTAKDPALLLRGDAWSTLVADLFLYDLVIIDAPPTLAVTDAVLLGRATSGQILLSRSGETTREDLAEATALLATNGSRSLGVIVNNEKMRRSEYSYYGRYDAVLEDAGERV